jgi:hypothetical protein
MFFPYPFFFPFSLSYIIAKKHENRPYFIYNKKVKGIIVQ